MTVYYRAEAVADDSDPDSAQGSLVYNILTKGHFADSRPSKLVMAKFQGTVIGKNSSSCSSKRFSFQVLLDRLLPTLSSCHWISKDGGCCTSCPKNELFLAKQFSGAIV